MNVVNLESQVEFKLEDVFSWGVKKDRFRDYSIPVVLGEKDIAEISNLADSNDAKNPIYGRTLYLRSALSDKHKTDLLDKGRTNILVHFRVTGVSSNTKRGTKHLVFKVIRLRKVDKPEAKEDLPED